MPADVAIMRASDTRAQLVRQELVSASRQKAFQNLFGTTGNVRGALFSHGTHELRAEQASPDVYIGSKLITTLSEYDELFTVSPKTDAPTGGSDTSVPPPPSKVPCRSAFLVLLALATRPLLMQPVHGAKLSACTTMGCACVLVV